MHREFLLKTVFMNQKEETRNAMECSPADAEPAAAPPERERTLADWSPEQREAVAAMLAAETANDPQKLVRLCIALGEKELARDFMCSQIRREVEAVVRAEAKEEHSEAEIKAAIEPTLKQTLALLFSKEPATKDSEAAHNDPI